MRIARLHGMSIWKGGWILLGPLRPRTQGFTVQTHQQSPVVCLFALRSIPRSRWSPTAATPPS